MRVEQVRPDAAWRDRAHAWSAVTPGMLLHAEAELRTGANGTVKLRFDEDSTLELEANSELKLESLRNAHGGVLVWVSLRRGGIRAQVSPKTTLERAFSVSTRAAAIVVEGTVFSVRHDAATMTTVAVEEGIVFVQPESQQLYPLNLKAGQQVSLNLSVIGPLVAAGAPPGLTEPQFPYALLDLGQWQVCEVRETEICGSWDWNHGNQRFNATWSDGASAVLKVEALGDGEIILSRVDRGRLPERLAARYVGRNAGTDFDGDVAVQLIAGEVTWAERGKQRRGTWHARSCYWIDMGTE